MSRQRMQELEDRFLRYVRIDSQSDEDSTSVPSTDCQWDVLRLLETELNEIGADRCHTDRYGLRHGHTSAYARIRRRAHRGISCPRGYCPGFRSVRRQSYRAPQL